MGPSATGHARFFARHASIVALACLLLAGGCGHVSSLYRAPKDLAAGPPIKRLAVRAWAPEARGALAPLLEAVASDYLKLRRNYFVANAEPAGKQASTVDWRTACTERTEAVLFVRVLDMGGPTRPSTTTLGLSTELVACTSGALLYRSEGRLRRPTEDRALKHLAAHYVDELGPAVAPYVPCAFSLLQELLTPLADVELTEEEIAEKIELE